MPWSGAGLLRHLLGGASIGVLTQAGFAVLAFANAVILARLLGVSGYGAFNSAIAWISIAIMPATLGFRSLLVKQLAVYRTTKDWSPLSDLLAYADRQVLLMSGFVLLVIGCLSLLLYQGDDDALMQQTLWVALPLLPLLALSRIREGALQGWEALARSQVPGMLVRPGLLLSGLLMVAWGGSESLTPSYAMAINLFATLCALGLLMTWGRQSIPRVDTPVNPQNRSIWRRAALPMMIAGNMQVLLSQTDVLILGVISGAEETGVYSAVVRMAYFLVYGNIVVDLVLAPVIARFHAKEQLQDLQTIITRVVRLSLLMMLPLAALMVHMRESLLDVFGAGFSVGALVLVVLIVGRIIDVALGSGGLLLTMTGHEVRVAKGYFWAAVANFLLNLLLIPQFGAMGAAISTVCTLFAAKLYFALAAHRVTGVSVTIFRF